MYLHYFRVKQQHWQDKFICHWNPCDIFSVDQAIYWYRYLRLYQRLNGHVKIPSYLKGQLFQLLSTISNVEILRKFENCQSPIFQTLQKKSPILIIE